MKKFAANLRRDGEVYYQLKLLGWRTSIIWECAIRDKNNLTNYIRTLGCWIRSESEYLEIPEPFTELDNTYFYH